MSARAVSIVQRPFPPLAWAIGGAASAVLLGTSAAFSVKTALVVLIAIGVTLTAAIRPARILSVLAISIFLELVAVSGTTISRLLAPIALLIVAVELIRGATRLRAAQPLTWVVLYSLWAIASGLWTVSVNGTVFQLGSLAIALVYMLAFATLLQDERDLYPILYLLAIVSLIVGIISIFSSSGRIHLGSAVQAGRGQGGVGDPDFFAAYQLLILPLLLVLAARTPRRAVKGLAFLAIFANIGSVLTSLSRGGFIALAFLLIVLLVLPARLLFQTRARKAGALILVVIGTTVAATHYSGSIVPRVSSIFAGSGSTSTSASNGSGRTELWHAATRSIHERPFLGLGYGAFAPVSNELLLSTPGVDLTNFPLRPSGLETHNSYLGSWAELGLPGLILFLGLFFSTGIQLRRTAVRATQAGADFVALISNALLVGLGTWGISSIFLSMETSRGFWIVLGLALALPKLLEERIEPEDS